jgi:hypothetical protein
MLATSSSVALRQLDVIGSVHCMLDVHVHIGAINSHFVAKQRCNLFERLP